MRVFSVFQDGPILAGMEIFVLCGKVGATQISDATQTNSLASLSNWLDWITPPFHQQRT